MTFMDCVLCQRLIYPDKWLRKFPLYLLVPIFTKSLWWFGRSDDNGSPALYAGEVTFSQYYVRNLMCLHWFRNKLRWSVIVLVGNILWLCWTQAAGHTDQTQILRCFSAVWQWSRTQVHGGCFCLLSQHKVELTRTAMSVTSLRINHWSLTRLPSMLGLCTGPISCLGSSITRNCTFCPLRPSRPYTIN